MRLWVLRIKLDRITNIHQFTLGKWYKVDEIEGQLKGINEKGEPFIAVRPHSNWLRSDDPDWRTKAEKALPKHTYVSAIYYFESYIRVLPKARPTLTYPLLKNFTFYDESKLFGKVGPLLPMNVVNRSTITVTKEKEPMKIEHGVTTIDGVPSNTLSSDLLEIHIHNIEEDIENSHIELERIKKYTAADTKLKQKKLAKEKDKIKQAKENIKDLVKLIDAREEE